MANRLSKEKASLIASNYCTNGFKKVQGLLDAGYKTSYASSSRGLNLYDNTLVIEAIACIQAKSRAGTGYSVTQCQEEYEEARQLGIRLKQPSAVVSAVTGKARLYGFDKDVQASPDQPLPMTETQLLEAHRAANVALASPDSPTKAKAGVTGTEAGSRAEQA
jgi:hypothetical protein